MDWCSRCQGGLHHTRKSMRRATSRASTPDYAIICSMEKYSALFVKPRSSSKHGGAIIITNVRIPHSDTNRRPLESSIRRSLDALLRGLRPLFVGRSLVCAEMVNAASVAEPKMKILLSLVLLTLS